MYNRGKEAGYAMFIRRIPVKEFIYWADQPRGDDDEDDGQWG
jgi:hypothetical protein